MPCPRYFRRPTYTSDISPCECRDHTEHFIPKICEADWEQESQMLVRIEALYMKRQSRGKTGNAFVQKACRDLRHPQGMSPDTGKNNYYIGDYFTHVTGQETVKMNIFCCSVTLLCLTL